MILSELEVCAVESVGGASGDDTYAYRLSFMNVHVGGRAWTFNIPGGTIESPGKVFCQLSSGGHWQ